MSTLVQGKKNYVPRSEKDFLVIPHNILTKTSLFGGFTRLIKLLPKDRL